MNASPLIEDASHIKALIQSSFFKNFLKLDVDRCNFICEWLTKNKIPHTIVKIGNKKHIIIKYAPQNYNNRFKIKTLVAHYDREKNTQGANDNSVACIQLMLFAKALLKFNTDHNMKIIFTDGEEAGSTGVSNQGSYALGTGLKKLNMGKDSIFVFDMCGRGDVLILSKSGILGRAKKNTVALNALHSESCEYAKIACPNQWQSILTPYSDNAGFIAADLSAQVITVLPHNEVNTLLKYLPKNISENFFCPCTAENTTATHTLIDLIIKNKKPDANSPFSKIIPKTWQLMHTKDDCIETITPSAFILIERYLKAIALAKRI